MTDQNGSSGHPAGRKYEADVYAEVHRQVDDDNRTAGFWDRQDADAVAADVAGLYSTEQADKFSRSAQKRSGLDASGELYESLPHSTLAAFVRDASPETLDAQGRIANNLGNALQQFTDTIKQAQNKAAATWQGRAAEAAHTHLSNFAGWADQASESAFLSSQGLSLTSASAHTAKTSMPEEIPFDRDAEYTQAYQELVGGNPAAGLARLNAVQDKQQKSMEAHQNAARVLHNYDTSMHQVGAQQPAFATPPAPGAPTAVTSLHSDNQVQTSHQKPSGAEKPGTADQQRQTPSHAVTTPGPDQTHPPETSGPGHTGGTVPGHVVPSGTKPLPGDLGSPGSYPVAGSNPETSTRVPVGGFVGDLFPGAGLGVDGGRRTSGFGPKTPGGEAGGKALGEGKGVGSATPGSKVGEVTRGGSAASRAGSGTGGVGGPGGARRKEEDREKKGSKLLRGDHLSEALGPVIEFDEDGRKVTRPVLGESTPRHKP